MYRFFFLFCLFPLFLFKLVVSFEVVVEGHPLHQTSHHYPDYNDDDDNNKGVNLLKHKKI